MARYTGPKSKVARRFGEPIFGPDKVLSKKNYPPGQHGEGRRRKSSEYGIQLAKKQSIPTGCWNVSSATSLRQLNALKG